MHENNIALLREEAQRLLSAGIGLLDQMMATPGIVVEPERGEAQLFDPSSTPVRIGEMRGELGKVENLEMVLAVVGTMKAGKSTTINAIVGAEVLPNRNRPMTALPTLIRHTPGQSTPTLKFDNAAPINELIVKLAEVIDKPESRRILAEIEPDKDMEHLIGQVMNRTPFKTTSTGSEQIFAFLKALNDLVRLSSHFSVEFPFASYCRIEQVPSIEVEFGHLRGTPPIQGRLSLLDTPGPNEAGQPHLRKMLREQLRNASAILAILDFTQLKSEADAELHKELSTVNGGRVYALVNKFDQRDRNSDSEETVRKLVANTLMPEVVSETDVFPVSSKHGYLANRVRTELALHGRLPDYRKEAWVEDFGEEALGPRWKKSIDDPKDLQEAADELWGKSQFQKPLEDVVEYAHARAAALVIQTTAEKMIRLSADLGNFLGARKTALAGNAEWLKQQINELLEDIQSIVLLEEEAQKEVTSALGKVSMDVGAAFEKIKTDVASAIEIYFKEGKAIEREQWGNKIGNARSRKKSEGSKARGGFRAFLNWLGTGNADADQDFNPDKETVQYNDAQAAQKLMAKIQGSVSSIMEAAQQDMREHLDKSIEHFKASFTEKIETRAKTIITGLNTRMTDEGFDVSLAIPDIAMVSFPLSGYELIDDVIQQKTRSVTRQRRQTGAWGKVCSWFNTDDWGWEEYRSSEDYFEVNLRTVQTSISAQIDHNFAGLSEMIEESVKTPLTSGTVEFFMEFKQVVQQIRGALQQSQRDHERSKAEKDELIQRLEELGSDVPQTRVDSEGLKQEVQAHLATETV